MASGVHLGRIITMLEVYVSLCVVFTDSEVCSFLIA